MWPLIMRLIQHAIPEKHRIKFARLMYEAAYSVLPASKGQFRALYAANSLEFGALELSGFSTRIRTTVIEAAESIYGPKWDYVSGSLNKEPLHCFERTIDELSRDRDRIDYLEIGSAQGMSMSFIGLCLSESGHLGTLVSVDPYFDGGYTEESTHPATGRRPYSVRSTINKSTKCAAESLYRMLGLSVKVMETTSREGLVQLVRENQRFDLVFIDGYHAELAPALDFGISLHLLRDGGAVMLDDHLCRDVKPIKKLCDNYCEKIAECWKVACYRLRPGALHTES
jgi:hypothetical protein